MPPPPTSRSHRAAAALWGLVAAATCLWAAGPVTTNDLYWHLETGELLARAGGFPGRDPFSFTATDQVWYLHEWLTQLLFYGCYRLGDLHALRLLTGLAALGILLLVGRLFARELGPGWPPLLGALAFLALGASRLQTRPTLASIALLLALLTWLTRRSRRWTPRGALAVLALVVVWVNLHSVGLLAVVLYGAYAVGEAGAAALARRAGGAPPEWAPPAGDARRHLLTAAAAFAVSLANPAGLDLWRFALQDKAEVMQMVVDEWAPFSLLYADNEALTAEAYAAMLAALALLAVVYLATGVALSRRAEPRTAAWPDPSRAVLVLVCVGLALSARRFHWLMAPALALSLGWLRQLGARGLLPRLPRPALPVALWRRGWLGAALLAGVLAVAVYRRELRHEGQLLHRAAAAADYWTAGSCRFFTLPGVEFLRQAGLRGNAFCHYGSGGLLSFHLYPAIRVFIDSRIDLYRRAIYLDYLAVAHGRADQNAILDRYGASIYYRHWDLAPLVDPRGWILVYRGRDGEIWLRDREGQRQNLARCAAYWAARGVAFSARDGLAPPS